MRNLLFALLLLASAAQAQNQCAPTTVQLAVSVSEFGVAAGYTAPGVSTDLLPIDLALFYSRPAETPPTCTYTQTFGVQSSPLPSTQSPYTPNTYSLVGPPDLTLSSSVYAIDINHPSTQLIELDQDRFDIDRTTAPHPWRFAQIWAFTQTPVVIPPGTVLTVQYFAHDLTVGILYATRGLTLTF